MKIQSKIKIILILIFAFLIIGTVKVNAASISVGASKSSVSPGESFTVSITANGATGKVNISVSNGSVSSSSLWLEPSGSVTVTAGSSGSVRISVSAVDMSDSSGNEVSPSGSTTVNIIQPSSSGSSSSGSSSNNSSSSSSSSSKPSSSNTSKPAATTNNNNKDEEEKSSNALLSAITIETEGVVLSPEFSKDVLEYAINIPNEINEINITATPEDEKSEVVVTGNTELKVGENPVTIEVTAEDGTKQVYSIKVIKAREKLALKTLVLKYEDENGEIKELKLDPAFISNIYEYSIGDISYKISKILVEATANLEGATIEITGNENLKVGENIITITIRIPKETQTPKAEGEELEGENQEVEQAIEDEVITYTIKLNKEQAPSAWQNFKDKIAGIIGTIGNWFNNNQRPLILGSLIVCILAMLGLSIYIVFDARKYKMLMQKLGKVSELINLENEAEVESLDVTSIKPEIVSEEESIQVEENAEEIANDIPEEKTENNVIEEADNSVSQANEKIDNILENIAKEKNVEFKEELDDGGIFGRRKGRHF